MSRKRYPLRVTRTAHGIRAQDLRTLVRTAWWARRWIAALEAMRLGARLGRGRQYALSGQVTDLVVEGPHVEASIQGSRPDPYKVTLDFTSVRFDPCGARTSRSATATAEPGVVSALRTEPMLLARLLTDDLPTEIEELLRAEGVPLFPKVEPLGQTAEGKPIYDVRMKCTCPDWARPCKHIVAVLFHLGEEIASHPASLLALRGVDVEDLVPSDGSKLDAGLRTCGTEPGAGIPIASAAELPLLDGVSQVGEAAPFLKRLGPVPFWRGGPRCLDALGKIYGRVRPTALEAVDGQSIDLR